MPEPAPERVQTRRYRPGLVGDQEVVGTADGVAYRTRQPVLDEVGDPGETDRALTAGDVEHGLHDGCDIVAAAVSPGDRGPLHVELLDGVSDGVVERPWRRLVEHRAIAVAADEAEELVHSRLGTFDPVGGQNRSHRRFRLAPGEKPVPAGSMRASERTADWSPSASASATRPPYECPTTWARSNPT
jgi:hypothetical protein